MAGNGLVRDLQCHKLVAIANAPKHDLYDEALGLTLEKLPSIETRTISDVDCSEIERNIKKEI